MVIINMQNTYSKIENLPSHVMKSINDKLSYEVGGFGQPTEQKFLYDNNLNRTYTGLVPYILSILKKKGINYQLNDLREKHEPNANFRMNPEFQARDYQQEIVDRATSREILQAATGGGKTFIMAKLIEKFNVKPVLVIAPKVSLAMQIKEEFEKFLNTKVGVIGGGERTIQDIIVCTPQSVDDITIKQAKLVMCDECHFIPANTIFSIFKKAENAYYRIGVSATPWRDSGDDILLEAVLNIRKPKLSLNASKLILKEKLTPCDINFIHMDSKTEWQGSYNATYEKAISDNFQRNCKIVQLASSSVRNGKTPIILITKIKHGELLLSMLKRELDYTEKTVIFENKEYTVGSLEFISGCDDLKRRQAVFKSVKDGFTKVLIGSTIADEGLDLPILDTLILSGSGKSSTRAFQRVGRVLRLYPGKTRATVYDFIDSNLTFYKQAMIRKALYETEPEWNINILN